MEETWALGIQEQVVGWPASWPRAGVFGMAPGLGEKQIWGYTGSHSVQSRGPGSNVLVVLTAGL